MPLKAVRYKAKNGRFRRRAQEALARGEKAPEVGAGHGAPTVWREEFVSICGRLARLGLSDPEMADVIGVAEKIFRQWKYTRPEFAAALAQWKGAADDRVERRFYEKAIGYSYPSEKIVVVNGEVQRVPITVHVPPSDYACMYWLENRRPDIWKRARIDDNKRASDEDRLSDAELFRQARIESYEELFTTSRSTH